MQSPAVSYGRIGRSWRGAAGGSSLCRTTTASRSTTSRNRWPCSTRSVSKRSTPVTTTRSLCPEAIIVRAIPRSTEEEAQPQLTV